MIADTSTEVDVRLIKRVITRTGGVVTVGRNVTTNTGRLTAQSLQTIPAAGANPQNFSKVLLLNPGFVESSVNVVHPRGEHASTSIYFNGVELPGALQGRAGPLFSPDIIQSADIQTGGYSPEYGGETAAILNLSLRSGPIKPFETVNFGAGGYGTLDQELTFGGQGGTSLGQAGPFRYLFNVINRTTQNAVEPPQPGHQDAHNHARTLTGFGNLEYVMGDGDQFSLVLNTAPGQTQVANRYGLPDKYAPVGQGYGYGGARNADGGEAGVTADPAVLGSQTLKIASQQGAGQDVTQNDENSVGLLSYRHNFGGALTGLLSASASSARLDIRNHSPSIDLNSIDPATGYLTTIDNSIEFDPTLQRKSSQSELTGSLTQTSGTHTYKAGFQLTNQTGDESYQFIPQSQLALDAEAAIQAGGGPQFTPDGAYQMDGSGNPVLDALGNQVFTITPGSTTPVVSLRRKATYNVGYAQDTWRATRQLTVNYGLRLDSYFGKDSLSPGGVKKNYLSPRLNLAYGITPADHGPADLRQAVLAAAAGPGRDPGHQPRPADDRPVRSGLAAPDHAAPDPSRFPTTIRTPATSSTPGCSSRTRSSARTRPCNTRPRASTASSCLTRSRRATTSAWAATSPTPTPSPSPMDWTRRAHPLPSSTTTTNSTPSASALTTLCPRRRSRGWTSTMAAAKHPVCWPQSVPPTATC